MKKKRSATAIRTERSKDKYKAYGLKQYDVWSHPDEIHMVRNNAANNPKTKAIRKQLKST